MKLRTKRLTLISGDAEHLRTEMESPEKLGVLLNTAVPEGWPPGEYDRHAQEYFYELLNTSGKELKGWLIWYIILNENEERGSTLIAAGGFYGPPNDKGEVEIGYSVVTAYQGKGFGTELADGLIKYAFNDGRVNKVVAHTSMSNVASCKVLEKLGFTYVGEGKEEGSIRFELNKLS